MFDLLLNAIQDIAHVQTLLFLLLGVMFGLIFGVIPGLGGTTALAILMPLTFGMTAIDAFAMSGGIMGAVAMGGAISAILLNTPGTAPNAATTLDGFPLAKQGRAAEAIGAAATASPLGGLFGVITLLMVLPVAKELILLFGPPEFFLLAVFGLITISLSDSSNLLKGLIAAGVGLMLAFVGYDTVTGGERFSFGSDYLFDGIPLVPALVGLFGVTEMIHLSITGGTVAGDAGKVSLHGVMKGVRATFKHWKVVIRGSLIGTIIGAVPGVGGTVATFIAYSTTKRADPHPETFGTGRIEGVIAPESANNAKDSGALLPTLAFGIPGSAEMAVFLGILVLHGMQPGPMMLLNNEREIYALIIALTLSAVFSAIIGITLVRWLAMITMVKGQFLAPIVIAVSLVGTYAIDSRPGDVVIAALLGILGYLMLRFNYPRLPLVIALVLGETAERGFLQSMMIGHDDWGIFIATPTSIIMVLLILFTLGWSFIPGLLKRFKNT
jgi:putative tricarboxylic transport membrane protein